MAHSDSKFNLLKGNFSKEDAKEVLETLFKDKIQYHQLRNFSHEERFGHPEAHAVERIHELKATLQQIVNFLRQNEEADTFKIHADISIAPVK